VAPFTPDDLPGYAGELFDQLVADPGLLRLTQWKALERPQASEPELAAHLDKARALAGARGATVERGMDTLMIVLAAAQAWSVTAPAIRNPAGDDEPARLARHRAAVVAAVAAVSAGLLD
jgi:hypothetical protein